MKAIRLLALAVAMIASHAPAAHAAKTIDIGAAAGSSLVWGLARNPADGHLFVSTSGADHLLELSADGTILRSTNIALDDLGTYHGVGDLAFDTAGTLHALVVSFQPNGDGTRHIVGLAPDDSRVSLIDVSAYNSSALTFDPTRGNLLMYGVGGIIELSLAGEVRSTTYVSHVTPDIAIDAGSGNLFALRTTAGDYLDEFARGEGGLSWQRTYALHDNVRSIEIDPVTGDLYALAQTQDGARILVLGRDELDLVASVPLPAPLVLFVSGMAALAMARGKRRPRE